MGEVSSKSSSYYEHDNRLGAPDFDKEPADEYPRPGRNSNYPNYRYERFEPPSSEPYFSKNIPASPSSGYSSYPGGGFNNSNYFPQSGGGHSQGGSGQNMYNPMTPMVSQSPFVPMAPSGNVAANAVPSNFNNQYQPGQAPYKNNYYANSGHGYYNSRFNNNNSNGPYNKSFNENER